MKRRIVELETALNQQLIVAKSSTPVKSPKSRSSTTNRATTIYGGGLMGGARTRNSTGTTVSPHTLPPAGLTTTQLGQLQRPSSTSSSSNSLRSPPVANSPTRSAKTNNKSKEDD